jgi:hypothetical protein
MLIRHVPAFRLKIRRKRQPELHQQANRQQRQLRAKTRRFIRVQAQAVHRIMKGRVRVKAVQIVLRHIRLRADRRTHRRLLRAVTALQAGRVRHHPLLTALQAGRVHHHLRAVTVHRAGRQVHRVQAVQAAGHPVAALPVQAAAVHVEDNNLSLIIKG